jgi:hypothetical protein
MGTQAAPPAPCKALKCRRCNIALTAILVGFVATMAMGRADAWIPAVHRHDTPRALGKQPQIPPDRARRGLGIARVVDQGGACTLTRVGAKAPTALRAGMEVATGDAMSCDARSYATLEFGDGSQLRVQPNSKILLDATWGGSFFGQNFAPRRGWTQSSVPTRDPSSFRVQSPSPGAMTPVNAMLAGVASDNGDAAARSEVERGPGDVAGQKRTVPAAAGLGLFALLGAAPPAAVPLRPLPA